MDDLKIPPHSIEAEQSLIGAMILDNDLIDEINTIVRSDDFFSQLNENIYQAIINMHTMGKPVDMTTLSDHFDKLKYQDESIFTYLAEVQRNTPSTANSKTYARIVKERSILRKTISASYAIADKCFNTDGDTSIDVLGFAEQKIGEISESIDTGTTSNDASSILDKIIDDMERRTKSGETISGRSTGLPALDERIDGLEPAEMIVLAARPSMGKTTLALNMVRHDMFDGGRPIVFSLETSATKVMRKILSDVTNIWQGKLKNPQELNDRDWHSIANAMAKIKQTPIEIIDDYHMTIPKMRLELRRYTKKHGLPTLVVIDYIQLMSGVGKNDNRTNEISEISRGIKGLAKEFKCPIIALSQLNRGLESRSNKRPLSSDLRESGQIEQDADKIIFIYRDEVYNENSEYKNIAELIVSKSKEGEIGKVAANFDGAASRFSPSQLNAADIQETYEAPIKKYKAE